MDKSSAKSNNNNNNNSQNQNTLNSNSVINNQNNTNNSSINNSTKEKMRILIETNVTDKVKAIFKENEVELDRQLLKKQEAAKEDGGPQYVRGKIHETVENGDFSKLAKNIADCRNINPNFKVLYQKTFEDLQKLFNSIDKSSKDNYLIKVKINPYITEFTKQTYASFAMLREDFVKLNQAGCCGVGSAFRSFQDKYREFEFKALIWKVLIQMENQNIEYSVLKPTFNEKEFRTFISNLINQTYPDQVGGQQVIEKEVIKYIEVPKIQIVEKTNTKEVPVVVERIVEKVVYKNVEVKVPAEIREVIKEVVRNVIIPDRIREAHEMLFGLGKPQNVTEALNIYYEEAEVNNNVLAFNAIGQIFLEGKLFPKDLNKSFNYYEKSASMQDPEGLYRVGSYMFKGIIDGFHLSQGRLSNRDQELEEAVMYLQKASEQGHLEALTDLGEVFEHGLPSTLQQDLFLIPPELEQAEFYYTQGKKIRYPRAICLLGLFYLNNQEYKQKIKGDNARKAIKYFELARDLGYSKAYFYLASCSENGSGFDRPNLESAKSNYKEGSLRGDKDCKVHYMFYLMQDVSNSGNTEDYRQAYHYFRDVLIQDPQITETYFYLGHLYECGFGVARDPQISMSYFNQGAIMGNASCMNKLGDFYHSGHGVPLNQREALKWYQQAAQLKDPQALINLGTIYENGYEGIAVDRAKAFNCYEEASKLNNPMAFFHLGLMYEAGRYVSKDMNTAIEMYKKAAIQGCQPARDVLIQKKVPIIYHDGFNSTSQNIDETDILLTGFDKYRQFGQRDVVPLISNPIVTHMGKKTNQNILQSKLDRQQQDDGKYQSILLNNLGQMGQNYQDQNQQNNTGSNFNKQQGQNQGQNQNNPGQVGQNNNGLQAGGARFATSNINNNNNRRNQDDDDDYN